MNKHEFNHYRKCYPSVNSLPEAKALYERTTPLAGPRRHLDIRPIGNDRYEHGSAYRIVKLHDTSYVLTHNYKSRHSSPGIELNEQDITWKTETEFDLQCRHIYWTGINNFISQVLPSGVFLHRYDTKMYVGIRRQSGIEYFYAPCDKVLKFKNIDGQWHILNPVQEYRLRITEDAIKKGDLQLDEFEKYAEVMWPLITKEVAVAHKANYYPYWLRNEEGVKNCIADKSQWLKSLAEVKKARHGIQIDRYGDHFGMITKPFHRDMIRGRILKFYKECFLTDKKVPLGTRCYRHHILK